MGPESGPEKCKRPSSNHCGWNRLVGGKWDQISAPPKYGPQSIPDVTQADLLFWIDILNHTSKQGIDINNITFTEPTEICVSDACEHGLGGYNMSGLAWRWEIPENM